MRNLLSSRILISVLALGLSAAIGCGGDDSDGGDNADPVASFDFTPDCTTDSTTEISFMSTSSDPDGDTLTCNWSFESGAPTASNLCNQTGVTFPNQRPYTVSLTVSDGSGGSNTTSQDVPPCSTVD